MLPEIENRENREPELYYKHQGPSRPTRPYYGPTRGSPSYGHLYHKGMSYRNPMDYHHDPHDVEIFSHESLTYDYPIKKSFQEYEEEEQPYFQNQPDIHKINAIEDRSLNQVSQRLKRYPAEEERSFQVPYKADYEHEYEPQFNYNPPKSSAEKHNTYHFSRNVDDDHKVRYRSIDYVPKQEHVQPKFQSLNLEPNLRQDHHQKINHHHDIDFPAFQQVGNYHHEPNYVADMPHLPPPPEMLELQKNSLFPVDVPKIGVDAPYRPPELIFDELHRRKDDFKPKRKTAQPIRQQRKEPTYRRPSLKKFSDLDIVSNQEQASSFAPPTMANFDQEDELTEWEFPQMPQRLNHFTESPAEQFQDFNQEKDDWGPKYR